MAPTIALNATNTTIALNGDINVIVTEIKPLLILILAIFVYSVFIFKFYRFLAERDIIKQHWHKKYAWEESFGEKIIKTGFYALENLIITPIAVFFWFLVLAGLLLVISSNTPSQIVLVSMAIIGAIRIAAHYNNDLSRDLAKMIPFAFLGVYIVDMKILSINTIVTRGLEFLSMIEQMLFFLLFIVVLELALRIIQSLINAVKTKKETSELKFVKD